MLYDRKIKYLDYYENGERISGCGFAKVEVRERVLRLEVTVKGLYPTDTFARDVVLRGVNAEVVLGQIEIQEGNGLFCYSSQIEPEVDAAEVSYGKLQEIKIPIGGSREIVCSLSAAPERVAAARPLHSADKVEAVHPAEGLHQVEKERQAEVVNLSEATGKMDDQEIRRTTELHSANVSENEELRSPEPKLPDPKPPEPQSKESQPNVSQPVTEGKKAAKLLEDKWMQLSAIYPHIQPFGDDRDYLSLNPSDFVVFPAKNYKAVNNSFLLHGYYNYHHLILARVESRGQIRYYIGVPGNYYDREKQVAVMFGFESFECESEPAKTGDFGYYMMRTEL